MKLLITIFCLFPLLVVSQSVNTISGVAIGNIATTNGVAIANINTIGGVDLLNLKTGLISLWGLDEPSGTTVIDNHGSTSGTNNGGTVNVTGKIAKAYDMESDDYDYIHFGTSDFTFDYDDPLSVSFWYKFESDDVAQVFFSKASQISPYKGYTFRYSGSGTMHLEFIYDATYETVYNWAWGPVTGVWYNIVVTYDGSYAYGGAELYINENKQSTPSGTWNQNSNSVLQSGITFQLGGRNGSNVVYDGLIDQTAVWNIEITQACVTKIYNSGSGLAYSNW